MKRKLKFFLQRGREVCRPAGSGQHITRSIDQLKVCCRFSPHTLHLEKKVEVFPAGLEAGSAHIHFILKRKLKFFLQRGRQVCRPAGSGEHITRSLDQLKFWCRFSPHTLHLEKKVEVFPTEFCCRFSPHTLHLKKKVEVFPAEGSPGLQTSGFRAAHHQIT